MLNSKKISQLFFGGLLIGALIACIIPLKIVVSNPQDFIGFSYSDFFVFAITLSAVVGCFFFLVFLVLHMLSERLSSKAFTALFAYLVICGLYFSIRSGLDDGTSALTISHVTLSAVVAAVIVSVLFFEKQARLVTWIAFISAMIAMGVGLGGVQTGTQKHLHKTSFFDLSKNKKNIIVMSLDSLTASDITHILDNNPEMKKELSGFVFFKQAASVGPFTEISLATTALGRIPKTNKNYTSAFYNHSPKNIMNYLYRKSFSVSEYGGFADLEKNQKIIRVPPYHIVQRPWVSYMTAISTSLQRYSVLINKQIQRPVFAVLLGIEKYVDKNPVDELERDSLMDTKMDPVTRVKMLDIGDFNYLTHNLRAKETPNPTAHFYHFLFTHTFVTFDKNCKYSPSYVLNQNKKSFVGQTECGAKEFLQFIRKLKKLHVYDNSMIFFVSDHGSECGFDSFPLSYNVSSRWCLSRYTPLLMVKPFQSKQGFRTNNFNASLIDIAKTICEAESNNPADCERYTGVNLLGMLPNDNKIGRDILVTKETAPPDGRLYTNFKKVSVGRSQNVVQLFNDKPPVAACGKTLQASQLVKTSGMSQIDSWGRWSNGKVAKIYFQGDEKRCLVHQIKLKLTAYLISKHPDSHAQVLLNKEPIGNVSFHLGQKVPQDFTFNFPENLYRVGRENVLTLLIQNPVSPKALGYSDMDDRLLGIGLVSMRIG